MKNTIILHIDDSDSDRVLMRLQLDAKELHQYSSVDDAPTGHPYDVCLLDLHLHETHGQQTVDAVRHKFPGLPIMVVTNSPDESLEGVAGVLSKDDLTRDLVDNIKRLATDLERVCDA